MTPRVYLVEARTVLSAGLRTSLSGIPEITFIGSSTNPARSMVDIDVHRPQLIVVDEAIGWQALQELMRQLGYDDDRPKVLVVTGDPAGGGALRILQIGASGYLPATADIASLSKAIFGIIAGDLVFQPEQVAEMLTPLRPFPGGSRDTLAPLTLREREIFHLTGRGLEAKEIARRLVVSARTVDVHRANIRKKLGISGTHELVRHAICADENDRLENQMREFCRERRPLLLVEDDEVDVLSVKRALRELRAETRVMVAVNGEEALAHLRRKATPKPFLILLDINLPSMNGPEFLAELRHDPVLAALPVVVLTSSPHEADKERIYRLGVTGYFVKPATSREFIDLFRSLAQYWGSNARPGIPPSSAD